MDRTRDIQTAESLGLIVITIEEECSYYTPGSYWSYGTEGYVIDIHFAMPTEIAEKFENDEIDD
jgi:Iap family predicted aminopeptidase